MLSARAEDSIERSRALQQICETYWHPVYAYMRKRGFFPQDAEDVTQEFFAYLLETEEFGKIDGAKGKLRSFLLVAARNFMANEWKRRKAEKRGGKLTFLSIDLKDAESHAILDPADELTPDAVFERHWATTILNTVMERLRQFHVDRGDEETFEALKDFLAMGRNDRTYADVGAELGIAESQARLKVHRMRKKYRELLLQQIASTLEPDECPEEELRYLFGLFQ